MKGNKRHMLNIKDANDLFSNIPYTNPHITKEVVLSTKHLKESNNHKVVLDPTFYDDILRKINDEDETKLKTNNIPLTNSSPNHLKKDGRQLLKVKAKTKKNLVHPKTCNKNYSTNNIFKRINSPLKSRHRNGIVLDWNEWKEMSDEINRKKKQTQCGFRKNDVIKVVSAFDNGNGNAKIGHAASDNLIRVSALAKIDNQLNEEKNIIANEDNNHNTTENITPICLGNDNNNNNNHIENNNNVSQSHLRDEEQNEEALKHNLQNEFNASISEGFIINKEKSIVKTVVLINDDNNNNGEGDEHKEIDNKKEGKIQSDAQAKVEAYIQANINIDRCNHSTPKKKLDSFNKSNSCVGNKPDYITDKRASSNEDFYVELSKNLKQTTSQKNKKKKSNWFLCCLPMTSL